MSSSGFYVDLDGHVFEQGSRVTDVRATQLRVEATGNSTTNAAIGFPVTASTFSVTTTAFNITC